LLRGEQVDLAALPLDAYQARWVELDQGTSP
jgi:hypothetical protein